MALSWSPWYPLSGASRNQDIPRAPGLYRIRRADIPCLDYVVSLTLVCGIIGMVMLIVGLAS